MTKRNDAVVVFADRLLRMLPTPGTDPVRDAAVLIRDGRITAAGPREQVLPAVGDDVRRLEYPDATILPGLIDCHLHLVFDASADPAGRLRTLDDDALYPRMAERARSMLDAGVTTVRDLGDRGGLALRLRSEIAAGVRVGPRVLTAGSPLTVPNGHCWFLGGVVDEQRPIASAVRERAEAGMDLIKVMATGGGLTQDGPPPSESQFGRAEIAEIVREAHRHGMPVAAHAHGSDGIEDCVHAGVDTIEHGTWMAPGGFDYRPEVVRRMAEAGIAVCPGASPNWRVFAEKFGPERAEQVFGLVRRMSDAGVELLAGTDGGVPDAVFGDPVGSLEFFASLGFSNERILRMATSAAARGIGLGDVGTIRTGTRADLLVVSGDPLDDLGALRDPLLVIADGRPHHPGDRPDRDSGPRD